MLRASFTLVALLVVLAAGQRPSADDQNVCCVFPDSTDEFCTSRASCTAGGGSQTCNYCDPAEGAGACAGECDPLVCCVPSGSSASVCALESECRTDIGFMCTGETDPCSQSVWRGELCQCATPSPTPAPSPTPGPTPPPGACRTAGCNETACEACAFVVGPDEFQCIQDPAKLDACGKCDSDCKVVAENVAFTDGACVVVGGVNIADRLDEVANVLTARIAELEAELEACRTA